MATRQYIGARYVPKFYQNSVDGSANWQSNVVYDPLTYVTLTNGHMYISKKQVPATIGTPASNAEYWLDVGSYNGFIDELQGQIDDIDTLIGTGNLPHNETSIINALNYLNEPYEYVVWLGDSYTAASSLGADQNKRFATLVSSALGLTEKNYAQGGCGFIEGSHPYTTQATDAINDFTNNNLDKTKVKYVIIAGTRNDGIIAGSQAYQYEVAVQTTVNSLADAFPNATIVLFPMLWDCSFLPVAYLETIKRTKWALLLNNHQDRIRIVDYCYEWLSGMYNYILYQNGVNVHPNVEGHRIIAKHIYSALMGNNFDQSSFLELGVTWNSELVNTGHFTIDKTNHNIHVHLNIKFQPTVPLSGLVIFTHTIDLSTVSDVQEFTIGNQRIWGNLKCAASVPNSVPYYLDCTVNKTGDHTGTITYEMRCYSMGEESGKVYYDDITFKNGVIENSISVL